MLSVHSPHKGNLKGGAAEGRPLFVEVAEGRLLCVGCEDWAYLSVETKDMCLVESQNIALLTRNTCAVLRARTCALFRAITKLISFETSDVLFCAHESQNF